MNDEETKGLLRDILRWQKLQGIKILRESIPSILDSEEKKLVYEMADGKNSIKEVQAKAKIATGTIHKWWNGWLAQGILEKKGQKYQKIISLKELSIPFGKNKDNKKG